MKKLLTILLAVSIPLTGFSQAQINTKKFELGDFTEKILKVVLTGNAEYDSALYYAVKNCWHISPYEFCGVEEFNVRKCDSDYYFLITAPDPARRGNESGMIMLRLVKGGKRANKGINRMLKVVSVPLCPSDKPLDREKAFLPSLVEVIQNHSVKAMEKEIDAYCGLRSNQKKMSKAYKMRIVFAESDVAFDLADPELTDMEKRNLFVVSDKDEGFVVMNKVRNTLVSYSVHPILADQTSYCYNMLINPKTREQYYYRKYRIGSKSEAGFQKEDLLNIFGITKTE